MFTHIDFLENTGLVTAGYVCGTWKLEYEGAPHCYDVLSRELGIPVSHMIRSCSTHGSTVRSVSLTDGGYGVTGAFSEGDSFDGMVTDEHGLLLCTTEADCTPVYLLDPVGHAIGMVHSGWRGTAGRISENAVRLMKESFHSRAEDILVFMGPCMCGKCYEVGGELMKSFRKDEIGKIFIPGHGDRYFLDMPEAVRLSLTKAGVLPENIRGPEECTYENENLCSWRRTGDKTRHILTVIALK